MVLVASPSKPALLTEKGTIRRGVTLGQYAEEIAALYREESVIPRGILVPQTWTEERTTAFVRSVVKHFLPVVNSDEQDLLDAGCTRYVRVHVILFRGGY